MSALNCGLSIQLTNTDIGSQSRDINISYSTLFQVGMKIGLAQLGVVKKRRVTVNVGLVALLDIDHFAFHRILVRIDLCEFGMQLGASGSYHTMCWP